MRDWSRFSIANAATLTPWLGRLATVIMLALLAWLCASIYWTITVSAAPRPAITIDTDPQRVVPAIVSRHLFGIPSMTGATPASAPTDIRLNGVIAAQIEGQPAYALLAIEGKPAQVVREGDEVAPGVTLQRVLKYEVELLRGGQTQTLSLPERGQAPKR